MIISILNHKGGTGKTTTTINLGRAMALLGKRVLLVDMDAQTNLTYSLEIGTQRNSVGELLFGACSLAEAVVRKEGMDIVPATSSLADVEEAIIKNEYGYALLRDALRHAPHDYVLIDCPPSRSHLNVNALCASDHVIVPMLMEVLSLQGLNQMLDSVASIRAHLNPGLQILGVLGVLVDERRQLTRDILQHIQSNYPINVFNNYIRAGVRVAEAPSFGKSLFEYAPECTSARDYKALCNEVLMLAEPKTADVELAVNH
jgi:chromosome partitioning protein